MEVDPLLDPEEMRRVLASINWSAVANEVAKSFSSQPRPPPPPDVRTYAVEISPENLDLDKVSYSLFSITDPLGQIAHIVSDVISNISKTLLGLIKDAVKGIYDTIIKPVVDGISTAVNSVSQFVAKIASDLASGLSNIVSAIQSLPSTIASAFQGILDTLSKAISSLPEMIGGLYEFITGAIWSAINTVVNFITKDLPQMLKGIAEKIPDIFDMLKNIYNWITGKLWDAINWIYDNLKNLPSIVEEKVKELSSTLEKMIRDFLDPVIKNIPNILNLLDQVWQFITNLPNTIYEKIMEFSDTIKGWLSGIQDFLGKVWDTIQGLAGTIGEIINSAINGAVSSITGLLNSISGTIGTIVQQISNLFSWIGQQISGIVSTIGGMINGIVSSIGSMISGLTQTISGMISGIANAISSIPSQISNIISSISSMISGAISSISSTLSGIISTIQSILGQIPNMIMGAINSLINFISSIPNTIGSIISGIQNTLGQIWQQITSAFDGVVKTIQSWFGPQGQGTQVIVEEVGRTVPPTTAELTLDGYNQTILPVELNNFSLLRSTVETGTKPLTDYEVGKEWSTYVNWPTIGSPIYGKVTETQSIMNARFDQVAEYTKPLWDEEARKEFIGEIATTVGENVGGLIKGVEDAISGLRDRLDEFLGSISDLDSLFAGLCKFIFGDGCNYVADVLKNMSKALDNIVGIFKDPVKWFSNTFSEVSKNIMNTLAKALDSFVKSATDTISSVLGALSSILSEARKAIFDLGTKVVSTIVDFIGGLFKAVAGALANAVSGVLNFISSATKSVSEAISSFIRDNVVNQFNQSVTTLLGINAVGEPISSTDSILFSTWKNVLSGYYSEWGIIMNMGWYVMTSVLQYAWWVYLLKGMTEALGDAEIRNALKAGLGGILPVQIESQLLNLGVRVSIKGVLKPFTDFLIKGMENLIMGTIFGASMWLFEPMKYIFRFKFLNTYATAMTDILENELPDVMKQYVNVEPFIEIPSESNMKKYVLAKIALSNPNMTNIGTLDMTNLDVVKALYQLKYYYMLKGYPKDVIDWIADVSTSYSISFKDRFGVWRYIWLGGIWEQITHSELVRMTQRDIFPSVDTMVRIGWARGWNPDVTKMLYMLTFKYPSFTNLWKFYMRATSGMLWFSPPSTIVTMFSNEADALGAGRPVPPIEIQRRIGGASQLEALETAINTYFKWIEYANFSWFTPETTINKVNIGSTIYSNLGGWTADSWLMADIAAEIPGKIDLRWMSRFGIFMWLADKLAQAGISFNSYVPWVDIIPRILSTTPTSRIQVDLSWHSKLLQATGLHPAWVPLVTVAENISVISDEMTLMRTGWLNLGRFGLLTLDDVERWLSGLISIGYIVGYWNPSTKTWSKVALDIPVRWLPHERKLLEYRMAIDRVTNLFRDFLNYLRQAIRYLATYDVYVDENGNVGYVDRTRDYIYKVYSYLDNLFVIDVSKILGMSPETARAMGYKLNIDLNYLNAWLSVIKTEEELETRVRIKYWWYRLSGWLLYYIARGLVLPEDVERVLPNIVSYFHISPSEYSAYKVLLENLTGIVKRELVPTPTQIASIAEVLPGILDPEWLDRNGLCIETENGKECDIVTEAMRARGIEDPWLSVWNMYIMKKTYMDDVRRLETAVITAYEYAPVPREIAEALFEWFSGYGFSSFEISIIKTISELRRMDFETRRMIPTPREFVTMVEYVPELLTGSYTHSLNITLPIGVTITSTITKKFIEDAVDYEYVPEAWKKAWIKYAWRRHLRDEVNRMLTTLLTMGEYFDFGYWIAGSDGSLNPPPGLRDNISQLPPLGFDSNEIAVLTVTSALRRAEIEYRREAPSINELAVIAEYVPEILSEEINTTIYYPVIKVVENADGSISVSYGVSSWSFTGTWIDFWTNSTFLPSGWKEVIKKYLERRPLRDELRKLAGDWYACMRYGCDLSNFTATINGISYTNAEDILRDYGYSDLEIEILKTSSIIREQADIARSLFRIWLPTPLTLATLSEYVDVPDSVIDWVLEHRGIADYLPPELFESLKQYIKVRPLKSEAKKLLTAYVQALSYGVASKDEFESFVSQLRSYGFTSEQIELIQKWSELEEKVAEIRYLRREGVPTPRSIATMAEVVSIPESLVDDALRRAMVPEEWVPVWKAYIAKRPLFDDARRIATLLYRALGYGAVDQATAQRYENILKSYGWTDEELALLRYASELENALDTWRDRIRVGIPTLRELAIIAEYVPSAVSYIAQLLDFWSVPDEYREMWTQYVTARALSNEVRQLLGAYVRALSYGADLSQYSSQIMEYAQKAGYGSDEISILQLTAVLDRLAFVAREGWNYSNPAPSTLATLSEYVTLSDDVILGALKARGIPDSWVGIWMRYIRTKPIKSDAKKLLTTYIKAMRYGLVSQDEVSAYIQQLPSYGFTETEMNFVVKTAELEEAIAEYIYLRREYTPTPRGLATLAEYISVPQELIQQVFDKYGVDPEWANVWIEYLRIRPVYDDIRSLATAYFRALARGVNVTDIKPVVGNVTYQSIEDLLRAYGWTDVEIQVRKIWAEIEERIYDSREYIPTPQQLATVAEIVPWARDYFGYVMEYRRIPVEWQAIWQTYIQVKPWYDEFRRLLTSILTAYEYFVIDDTTLDSILKSFSVFGFEDEEIRLIESAARFRRDYNVIREVIGTPRSLVTMAEYSPTARDVALTYVYQMIDSLPIDDSTKQLLKAMWEEYIRIKPVYDEVRSYVRELVNDYASGAIDYNTLYNELQSLKDWGLDDYEIAFWLWLAQRRRVRYEIIYGSGYYYP